MVPIPMVFFEKTLRAAVIEGASKVFSAFARALLKPWISLITSLQSNINLSSNPACMDRYRWTTLAMIEGIL
jgi:hypothetical protein